MKGERACFGAGCFWGVEYVFAKFKGIIKTKVGYMGGEMENPTYEDVCTDETGHAEVLYLEFDPDKINYEKLLEIFWKCHDPTTKDRQGPDMGSQYRSLIFYYNDSQKKIAEKSKKEYEKILGKKIVTTIELAQEFYEGEDYHQQYYKKKGAKPYCHIIPKIPF